MIATFKFDLSDDSDKYKYKNFLMADEMASALDELRDFIRGKLKYTELNDETEKVLEEIRELIPPSGD